MRWAIAPPSLSKTPNSGSLLLDSVDVSGSNPGEPALKHGGVTTGAWVGVYAPDTEQEGFTSVINMGGATEATGIAPKGASTTAVLLVGSAVGPQGFNNHVTDVNTNNGTITADAAGVSINAGQAEMGTITAKAGDITVEAGGVPGNNTDPNNFDLGNINVEAFLKSSATGQVYLASHDGQVNFQFDSTVQSDSNGGSVHGFGVYVEAPTITSDSSAQVYAGKSFDAPGYDVDMFADGGSLQAPQISGFDVYLRARKPGFTGQGGPDAGPPDGPGGGGDLTLTGDVNAADMVTGISDFGTVTINPGITVSSAGAGFGSGSTSISLSAAQNLDVEGNLIADGAISLTAVAGDVTVGTNPNASNVLISPTPRISCPKVAPGPSPSTPAAPTRRTAAPSSAPGRRRTLRPIQSASPPRAAT